MAIDLKTLTPDTSFSSGAFLFGADSQSSSTPSIYGVDDVFGYLLGLSNTWTGQQTFAAGTITASTPLSITQTWNDENITFTAIKANVTSTASASGSLLMDLQVGNSSKFNIDKDGNTYSKGDITVDTQFSGYRLYGYASPALAQLAGYTRITNISAGVSIVPDTFGTGYSQAVISDFGVRIQGSGVYGWNSSSADSGSTDLILSRKTGANLQLGAADAAAAIAQTLSVQSIASGTSPEDDNKVGANFTIRGSAGTGSGAGGSIIFQVAPSGTSGPNQNSFVDALTINSARQIISSIGGTASTPALCIENDGSGFYSRTYGFGYAIPDATPIFEVEYSNNQSRGIKILRDMFIGWSDSQSTSLETIDVRLQRDDIGILALRNGTNAQEFRIYNTFTNSTDYERVSCSFSNDVPILEHEWAGSGQPRTFVIRTGGNLDVIAGNNSSGKGILFGTGDGTGRWQINSSGHILAWSDNNYDIGASGATRPRDVYVAGNLEAGGSLNLGGTTSSFPALKRDATTLKVRLADDSGDAPITASTAEFSANVAVNGANTSQYNLTVNGSFGVFDGSNTVFTVNDPTTTKVLEVVDENDNELFSVNNSTTGTLLEVINGANDTVFSVNSNTDGALLEVTSVYDDTVFTVNSQTTGPILEVSSAYGDNLLSVSDKGSVTVNGVTATANDNVLLDLSQTWNAGANTVSGINLNVTDTSSNTASTLMDLKVGGSSNFSVEKIGNINFRGHRLYSDATAIVLTNSSATPSLVSRTDFTIIPTASSLRWGNLTSFNTDLILSRKDPANLQLGAADVIGDNAAANLKAQTLSVQSVATGGTLENVVGKDFTIQGSAGTGSGAGGSIIFQVAPAGSSGTGQNTLVERVRIEPTRIVFNNDTGRYIDQFSNIIWGFNQISGTTLRANLLEVGNASDTTLLREAPGTLALRNGTNAQTFNIYNTYTDASNYERGSIAWKLTGQNSVPELRIEAEASGSGTIRGISLVGSYVELSRDNVLVQNDYNENIKLHNSYGIAWCSGAANDGSSIVSRLNQGVKANVGYGVELTVGAYIAAPMFEVSDAKTISSLPSPPVTGQIARVTDGDSGLTFGQVVVNSGSGATPYLVWYNGTNWTVIGA